AQVTLVAGPTPLVSPAGVIRVDVRSAAEMATAVDARVERADIFISVAAVSDFTPAGAKARKLKKTTQPLTLVLKPTTDILTSVAARAKPPYCVGFAAETNDVIENAAIKRRKKRIPIMVANRAQDTLGSDESEVTLLDEAGAHPFPRMDKLALARRLVGEIAWRLAKC